MKINKLDINGFGKFNGSSITLSEGVNIVYGSNEAGKSTLQLFIKAMFYGMKGGRATKEGIPAQLNRLKPWGGGSYAGVLEYSLENGQNFRVERDFEKGTAIVYDSSFNDVSGCFPALRDKLPLFAEKHIGLPEDCFEKTIFIRQLDTKLEGESSGGLLVRLANISQTGYEDISFKKAEQLLKEEIKKNIGTGRTTAQPADKLEARLGELRTERTAAAAKREAGLVNTKRLSQLREEYDRKQKEKAFLREAGELIAVRKALDGKKAAVKALKNVLEDIRVIREEIASAELERRAAGEGALGGARSRASIKRENKRRKRILIYTATALAATAAAYAVTWQALVPAFVLAASILILPLFIMLSKEKEQPAVPEAEAYPGRIEALKERLVDKFNIAGLSTGRQYCEVAAVEAEHAANLKEMFGLERTLEKGIEAIMDKYGASGLRVDFFDASGIRQSICDGNMEWLEESWRYSEEKTTEQLTAAALDIREYETLSRESIGDGDELQRIEEEISVLLEKKAELGLKAEALSLALENLQAAAAEIRESFSPALDIKMSSIISRMTGDRYSRIKADDCLRLMTVTPGEGGVKNVALLSGGTADQFYLALRIAAAELLEPEGEKLPLIMDEVFSQYDDERVKRTMEYLEEIGNGRQIIIMTCKKRELELAEEVFGKSCTIHILE